jgi:hypothetical protein
MMFEMLSDGHFWVFFDTATRTDYYKDVHLVTGLPQGSLLEYEYRDVRMDASVIAATERPLRDLPKRALVLYAQWTKFTRGDSDPTGVKPAGEMLYQSTRVAEVVAMWRVGERVTFQLRLGNQPRADPGLLVPIIDELTARSAIPYKIWVAFSDAVEVMSSLSSSEPAADWQRTVDRLSAPPMQFGGDKFLRVDPPRRTRLRTGSELRSKYLTRVGDDGALDHVYIVPERCSFGLKISTHEPIGASKGGIGGDRIARYDVQVPADGPVLGPVPSSAILRRTADTTISFESRHSSKADRKVGLVTISSDDALPAIAGGISFVFALKLAAWKRVMGAFLGAVGSTSVLAGGILTKTNDVSLGGTLAIVVGALVLAVGSFLYTGYWSFKT